MWVYDRFANMPGSWDPRIVDTLSPEEEFWLPVLHEARTSAIAALRRINEN